MVSIESSSDGVVRAMLLMAWYLEKALHGVQPIIDGFCFDINQIVKSGYALTNSKHNKIKACASQKDLDLESLLGTKIIEKEIDLIDKKILEKIYSIT